ncbi:hypothetical protein [Gracilibacillus sp. YIM 98692]|uniref:hypothetical protein n=1 Tax=Gracilibacillus sp. YIM 98692 TaxID=2663532 RepID=UPI0013D291B2|nr:hypothetical protein [Gracilibacillus sp. YIM 98692]
MDIGTIKDQLEWGKENLDNPLDNLELEQVEWLLEEIKQLKMVQYEYKCSGCGNFAKFLQRTCPNCGKQNYYTGSFKQEDLENWLKEKQEI